MFLIAIVYIYIRYFIKPSLAIKANEEEKVLFISIYKNSVFVAFVILFVALNLYFSIKGSQPRNSWIPLFWAYVLFSYKVNCPIITEKKIHVKRRKINAHEIEIIAEIIML